MVSHELVMVSCAHTFVRINIAQDAARLDMEAPTTLVHPDHGSAALNDLVHDQLDDDDERPTCVAGTRTSGDSPPARLVTLAALVDIYVKRLDPSAWINVELYGLHQEELPHIPLSSLSWLFMVGQHGRGKNKIWLHTPKRIRPVFLPHYSRKPVDGKYIEYWCAGLLVHDPWSGSVKSQWGGVDPTDRLFRMHGHSFLKSLNPKAHRFQTFCGERSISMCSTVNRQTILAQCRMVTRLVMVVMGLERIRYLTWMKMLI